MSFFALCLNQYYFYTLLKSMLLLHSAQINVTGLNIQELNIASNDRVEWRRLWSTSSQEVGHNLMEQGTKLMQRNPLYWQSLEVQYIIIKANPDSRGRRASK